MKVTCIICKGSGVCLPFNGVVRGVEEAPCVVCRGSGMIDEQRHPARPQLTRCYPVEAEPSEALVDAGVENWIL